MTKTRATLLTFISMTVLTACGGGSAQSPAVTVVSITPSSSSVVAVTPSPTPSPAATSPSPSTTPPAAASTSAYARAGKNVVFVGNDPADLTAYESWLGHRTDGIQIHTGRASWSDWIGSIGWIIDRWKAVDRTFYWSVPLIPQGATLADAGSGSYNANYANAAKKLATAYPDAAVIYIRTGWEFNGDWQPWAAAGKADSYKAAYRQFVTSFRSVSSRFVFEWTPNIGKQAMNPEEAYPGDDVVDIIGIDFYYNHKWDNPDPAAAWAWMVGQPYGLSWHRAFAATHNKPVAYAEWGVGGNGDGVYLADVAAWFKSQPFAYQSYWNSNADYVGKLSDDQFPLLSTPYKALVAPKT